MAWMAQSSLGSASRREASPLLFGTILFLASELLFFGGLFAAYFSLRVQTAPWPPSFVELDVPLAAVATGLLVISSFPPQAGVAAGRRRSAAAMRGWVLASLALGLAFLGMQGYDWLHLDFSVATDAYGTMFYAMTGFHALHVLAGLLLMLVVLGREAQGAYRGGDLTGAEAVAYYWHFVDAVWIALFATLFLLR
jgi:cytochrome c oxidase subunit 3